MVTIRKSSQIPKKNICNLFLKGHVINVHPCLLNNCFLCFVNHKYHISLTTVSQEQECFQMLVICILIKDYRVNFGKVYLKKKKKKVFDFNILRSAVIFQLYEYHSVFFPQSYHIFLGIVENKLILESYEWGFDLGPSCVALDT